ncbi:tetratricopeptide repeat protein [Paenibacillus macerans]|uniref:tetratricopeptide repeat protein n=1 Tax=Paenibacillus macerans TaxID=44252 RepID=UPI003D3186FF
MEVSSLIHKAIERRNAGQAEEARLILLELLDTEPDNPELLCQLAWTHDVLGREREAVPYYKKALVCGLSEEQRPGALLGLGSTYRTLGEYAKAKKILEQGLRQHPRRKEFGVFLAMALYNLGEHAEAMRLLLTELSSSSAEEGIREYARAIGFYADKLDQVWD